MRRGVGEDLGKERVERNSLRWWVVHRPPLFRSNRLLLDEGGRRWRLGGRETVSMLGKSEWSTARPSNAAVKVTGFSSAQAHASDENGTAGRGL